MKIGVYTLYKVQMILFGTDKMLYGIFSFCCEIHLVYLYNTYRERLLEK